MLEAHLCEALINVFAADKVLVLLDDPFHHFAVLLLLKQHVEYLGIVNILRNRTLVPHWQRRFRALGPAARFDNATNFRNIFRPLSFCDCHHHHSTFTTVKSQSNYLEWTKSKLSSSKFARLLMMSPTINSQLAGVSVLVTGEVSMPMTSAVG